MAFEVVVEVLVLKKSRQLLFGLLCAFAFFANLSSLLGGIPTKILNAFLYAHRIPENV
jgi:hypothetical protein